MSLSQYILVDEIKRQEQNENYALSQIKKEVESVDEYNEGLEMIIQDMQKIKDELGDFKGKSFVSFGF